MARFHIIGSLPLPTGAAVPAAVPKPQGSLCLSPLWVLGLERRTRGATGRAIKPAAHFFDSLDVNMAVVYYAGLAVGRWSER